MNNKIKADIFDITKDIQGITYQDYEKIVSYITKFERNTLGEENAKFYEKFRILNTILNNAGWEGRKNEMLDIFNSTMDVICYDYEDFLP